MLGYDNNEEETKRVVYTDANGVKWIRSGDIGHMDEQGFLYIDGRIKRIIIRHDGFKVFPTQIENVIATCPEVKACCAIGRADKDHSQGKLPVVYITLSREKKDKMKLKEELSSLCKQMLPEYMQPIDFVFIDKNVVIGDNNKIMANANILYGSRIGNGNTIFPGAVIGAIPQDLKFRGEESTAEIGDNNLIRENVTINRGTAAKGRTIVGNNNLLMEGVHVAHDALVGNGCIIGNSTKMAGEIVIDDNAIVSANVLMHQFCHVGSHVMIQGGCRFSKDIPPYIIAGREPIAFSGINIIGLRRRGFANEVIENIHNAYRIIYQSGLNTTEALKKIEDEFEKSPEIDYIIEFIRNSERGIIK